MITTMDAYLKRREHFRETTERAIRYYREQRYQALFGAVISACGTMLFDATEAEEREMMDIVRSRSKR